MTELRNSLADLAEQVREKGEIITGAERTSVELALQAGLLLCRAKDECQHGEWLPFLARADVSERKAQRWMQLARAGLKSDVVSGLGSLRAALDYIGNLELPKAGEVLFVSRRNDTDVEGDDDIEGAWITESADQPGHYDMTSVKPDDVVKTTKPPSGQTLMCTDGSFNGVWVTLDLMCDIPHEERVFSFAPIEILDPDVFDFLGDIDAPLDLNAISLAETRMPQSYENAVKALELAFSDYSLERAQAAFRAVRVLEVKMQAWPQGPQMAPIYQHIAKDRDLSKLSHWVMMHVQKHNPEVFPEGMTHV